MTLIKLINIIESLKKNPRYQKKWHEISDLLQENFSKSIYENIYNLVKRDLESEDTQDVLQGLLKMIVKFPKEFQTRIVSHLKTIDSHVIFKIFQTIPIEIIMQDYGILECYFKNPTQDSIMNLNMLLKKEETLMRKSCNIWIPKG